MINLIISYPYYFQQFIYSEKGTEESENGHVQHQDVPPSVTPADDVRTQMEAPSASASPPPPSLTTSVISPNSSSSIAFEDPTSSSLNLKKGVSNLNKHSKPPITIKSLATKFHMPQSYIDHMIKNDQPLTRDTTKCRRYCNRNFNFNFNFEFDYVIFY